jgi:transcriptional regulator with XRE-family HTH domain
MADNLGQIVYSRRKSLNLTQEKLAEKIGRSTALVGQIERGCTKPSFETLRRLKEVLMFDIDDACSDGEPDNAEISRELGCLISSWDGKKQTFFLEVARLVNEYFPESNDSVKRDGVHEDSNL